MSPKAQPPLIRSVHARNYRVLRQLDVRLDRPLHVMVGPNGIGKSTLFDAISFVFDLIAQGLDSAIAKRTSNFRDLVWQRSSDSPCFEIAIEFELSDNRPFRYEIAVAETAHGIRLTTERGFFGSLKDRDFRKLSTSRTLFPPRIPQSLDFVFERRPSSNNNQPFQTSFFLEPYDGLRGLTLGHSDEPSITLVPVVDQLRTADGKPLDRSRSFAMPAAADAVRQLQAATVRTVHLDTRLLTKALPLDPNKNTTLAADGRNLPWVLLNIANHHPAQFKRWLAHLRTALPSITAVRTSIREDDNHAYLMTSFENRLEVPSWSLSEGTLRLMALTLLAYLPGPQPPVYLLEEPENGIHPLAIETAYQALSSAYNAQFIVASHSPTLIRCVDRSELLCFSRDAEGGARIIPGLDHPNLQYWQEATDNDLAFATHILS